MLLKFVLSWNVSFSPPKVNESFAGYNSLDWDLWFLRVCRTSVQALLYFRVSIEKSGVILIGLLFYVILFFSTVAFAILSLFCTFSILIIIYREFVFWSSLFCVLCASCTCIGISFKLGNFSSMIY